jgi:hypothetical protein
MKPTFGFCNFANAPNQYRGKLTAVTLKAHNMSVEPSGKIYRRCQLKWNGNECKKTKVMIIYRQPFPVKLMMDQKQLENVESFM